MLENNSISFACTLSNLQAVRDFVREQLEEYKIPVIDKNQIVLAIDEVCTNLIVHSNKNDATQNIELKVELKLTPRGVAIELIEKGEPFDYVKYQEPNILDLKDKKSGGQMGMMLVRRIMDKIEYIHQDDQNICRLYKSLA